MNKMRLDRYERLMIFFNARFNKWTFCVSQHGFLLPRVATRVLFSRWKQERPNAKSKFEFRIQNLNSESNYEPDIQKSKNQARKSETEMKREHAPARARGAEERESTGTQRTRIYATLLSPTEERRWLEAAAACSNDGFERRCKAWLPAIEKEKRGERSNKIERGTCAQARRT